MENLKLIILDDVDQKLGDAFDIVAMMGQEGIGNFKLEVVDDHKTLESKSFFVLGDVRIETLFLNTVPNKVKAEEISNAAFFSSSGSPLWNYVANQSFYSVNFSDTKNDYFDEWFGPSDDKWTLAAGLLTFILGYAVRKYGDMNPKVVEDAVYVMNEATSHNRNSTHYKKDIKSYENFIEYALSKTFGE